MSSDKEELTQEDTGFILWALGIVCGQSDKMDEKHQKYIEEHQDSILEKIGNIHESFNAGIN